MNRNIILIVLLIYAINDNTFSQNITINNGGKLTVEKMDM